MVPASAEHPPGTAIETADGLLHGHIDRFASPDRMPELSLEPWLEVCLNTARLVAPQPEAVQSTSAARQTASQEAVAGAADSTPSGENLNRAIMSLRGRLGYVLRQAKQRHALPSLEAVIARPARMVPDDMATLPETVPTVDTYDQVIEQF